MNASRMALRASLAPGNSEQRLSRLSRAWYATQRQIGLSPRAARLSVHAMRFRTKVRAWLVLVFT